jgi:serine/threonine protein kinase
MTTKDRRAGAEPLPGYRLLAKVGQGGYGEVWRALGAGGMPIALKFVPLAGPVGDTEQRALQIMRSIRHPNLVGIFGVWNQDDTLIIAMELADATLLDRLQQAVAQGLPGIPAGELREYMREAAKGVDYLNTPHHQLGDRDRVGVQHRDIKPRNILLVGGGVKVADFGLARFLEQTRTGHTGHLTFEYAAPEFFQGQTSQWSDQYSLAVTYCHLRGGRLPFAGNAAQVIAGHLLHPPDLSMLLPEERPAVARALAKDAHLRWPSCGEFVNQLFHAPSSVSAPGLPVVSAGHPPSFDGPEITLPTTGQGFTLTLPDSQRAGPFRPRTDQAVPVSISRPTGTLIFDPPTGTEGGPPTRFISPARYWASVIAFSLGTGLLVAVIMIVVFALQNNSQEDHGQRPAQALGPGDDHGSAKKSAEAKKDPAAEEASKKSGKAKDTSKEPDPIRNGSQRKNPPPMEPRPIHVAELANLEGPRAAYAIAFSADGRLLASGDRDGKVKLWDVATRQEIAALPGHFSFVLSLAFTADGKTLVSGSIDKTLKVWDVSRKEELATLGNRDSGVRFVALSGDGHVLGLVAGGQRLGRGFTFASPTVELWDVPQKKALGTLSHLDQITALALTADGKVLASASSDKTIKLWDVAKKESITTWLAHQETIASLAFSADGKTLASGSRDKTVKVWNVARQELLTTLEMPAFPNSENIKGIPNAVTMVAFAGDDRTLAVRVIEGSVLFWDVVTRKQLAAVKPKTRSFFRAISGDGRLLAFTEFAGKIVLWKVERGGQ